MEFDKKTKDMYNIICFLFKDKGKMEKEQKLKGREYINKIEKKWKRNDRMKNKLIRVIEGSTFVRDEEYKNRVREMVLLDFRQNKEKELGGKLYKEIKRKVEELDKKSEGLKNMKEDLKNMKGQRESLEIKVREFKLDGKNKTTLEIQRREREKLAEEIETLKKKIEKLEKQIKEVEKELKVAEEYYGKKNETDEEKEEENDEGSIEKKEEVKKEPSKTLKEFKERTEEELRKGLEDKKTIIEILEEEDLGLDKTLRDEIRRDMEVMYNSYNEEIEDSLRLKIARWMSKRLEERGKIYNEIKNMPDGEEKNRRLAILEREERSYGIESSREEERGKRGK